MIILNHTAHTSQAMMNDIFENQYNEMSSAGYVGTYSEENFVAGLCYSYASYASIDTTFVDMPHSQNLIVLIIIDG